MGSSPLARGLPVPGDLHERPYGIIPARAGFTQGHGVVKTFLEDHPRSRGVYVTGSLGELIVSGSSPLARGLLTNEIASDLCCGIIPARAGFTPML